MFSDIVHGSESVAIPQPVIAPASSLCTVKKKMIEVQVNLRPLFDSTPQLSTAVMRESDVAQTSEAPRQRSRRSTLPAIKKNDWQQTQAIQNIHLMSAYCWEAQCHLRV